MTPSAFKADPEFAAFAGLTDDYIQKFLDKAVPYFSVATWGAFYEEGVANFVAHRIILANVRSTTPINKVDGNAVTEKHVGPVGVSFDALLVNKMATDPFMRTSYGQQYLYLRDLVGLGGLVV